MSARTANESPGLDWLYSTQLFGVKLGLDNTRRLLRALDLDTPSARILHVAGTNGKGSTCAFAHSLLSASGLNAGLFTSPHLIHFRERIRDSQRQILPDELETILESLRTAVSDWDPHPTFFELTLAVALTWFKKRHVDWIVLETGLGGRLDATNALRPDVCAITRIGLDHTEILGPTLADIAREKAGIIKPGIPIVTGPQEPEALAVLQEVAVERGAPWHPVQQPSEVSPLGIPGPHSAWNAAVAMMALNAAGVRIEPDLASEALKRTVWPGRFQHFGPDDAIILDGSHNPDAVEALVQTWRQRLGDEKAVVVYGGVDGKNHAENLKRLIPIAAQWHFTPLQSPRGLAPDTAQSLLSPSSVPTTIHSSLEEAIQAARNSGRRILIAGSLYLIGEALALLQPGPATFEPSHQ